MEWLASIIGSSLFKAFGDVIVQPILTAFLKSKDVDLEKFKVADASTTQLAVAVLDANVKFAEIKANYALSVLQWWPFRVILFVLLFFPAVHFSMIVVDSSLIWFVYGKYGVFHMPAVPDAYLNVEWDLLLFFVIAKPVDSAVQGAIGVVGRYLTRK